VADVVARPRGRPRLFDEDEVLDQLTLLYWEKGYAQTSMADLVDASGVHKSSLYSTFGSKDELFGKILHRYFDNRMAAFSHLVEASGTGIEGIHAFLEMLRVELVSGASQQGCLLVNTSTELCGTTPGFEDFGVEYRNALRERLSGLVSQAQSDDGADDSLTDERTNLLITSMFGLNVIVRGGGDAAEVGRSIDAMHATVDTWRT
jgi:AcrR family transcriptional regulator